VPQAGLSSTRVRDWAADTSLKLVSRNARAVERDSFANTFGRVMTTDTASSAGSNGGATTMVSTTKEALEAGRKQPAGGNGGGGDNFAPHFLRKLDPSLHHNVRRAIFANGNEFVDGVGAGVAGAGVSSKFRQDKFVPRAYGGVGKFVPSGESRQGATAAAQQSAAGAAESAPTPAPAAAAPTPAAATPAGQGFVGM